MKKYIVLYHAPAELLEKMNKTSPEDAKKGMEEWMVWANKCGDYLVDIGSPLGNGKKLSDVGCFPAKSEVVGFSILQTENMESACKLIEGHPHLKWDSACKIEIHEAMPMPG